MQKKILWIFDSFPSSQLLSISLKPASEYFELSVHVLFRGESYSWCNPPCFEGAWCLLLQEGNANLAFFPLCSLEGSAGCWTLEQVGVEGFRGWELSLNSSRGVCAGWEEPGSGELCGWLPPRVRGERTGDVGKAGKEKCTSQNVLILTKSCC